MEVDIDVKFIDEHNNLKLAVVSFGSDTEHEKFQNNNFIDRLVVYMNEKINRDLTFLEPVPLFGKASI